MDKTIVLIGRSDYIDIIDQKGLYILTHTLPCATINWACTRFESIYNFFLDTYVHKMYNHKWLGNPTFVTTTFNEECVKDYPHDIYNEHRLYQTDKPFTDKTLLTAGFTHDFAISYLIKKGYKNIILLGVADFENKDYAKGMNTRSNIQIKCSEKCKIKSKHLIENIFSKYANIITLNPRSYLSVPKVSIRRLIGAKYCEHYDY